MKQYVAFLRAINAGRERTVSMDRLRPAFESVGFFNIKTFGTSGNELLETELTNPA